MTAAQLIPANIPSDPVENRIHHAGFIIGVERSRNIDIFLDNHPHRHVKPPEQFVTSRPQDRPEHRFKSRQGPCLGQCRINRSVDHGLLVENAA